MKNILKYLSLFTLMAFMFTSCEKENIVIIDDPIVQTPEPEVTSANPLLGRVEGSNTGSADGLDLECVTILFPFEVLLQDESTAEVLSFDELITLSEYQENPAIDFVYPINLEDADGNEVNADNIEELSDYFISCIPDDGWGSGDWNEGGEYGEVPVFDIDFTNSCITLIYPFSVQDLGGNITVVNGQEELANTVIENEGLVFFAFPLSVTHENGEEVVLENGDELFEALISCDNITIPCDTTIVGGGQIACYELKYPLAIVLLDNSIETVNSEDEFVNLLLNGEIINFSFPLTLINENGEELVVENDNELAEAFNECYEVENPNEPVIFEEAVLFLAISSQGCYSINYPISLVYEDETSVSVSSNEEYAQTLMADASLITGLQYPLYVILATTQEVIEVSSKEDLFYLLVLCE